MHEAKEWHSAGQYGQGSATSSGKESRQFKKQEKGLSSQYLGSGRIFWRLW